MATGAGLKVTVGRTGTSSSRPCPDETNLAARPRCCSPSTTGPDPDVHLHIRKGIPVAGGMAGGSADAAAALVACDALWGTALAATELHALAAQLGSDVPFALMGGTALGRRPR